MNGINGVNGSYTNDTNINGSQIDGHHTNGTHANGTHANGTHATGTHIGTQSPKASQKQAPSEKDLILRSTFRYGKMMKEKLQLNDQDMPLLAHTLGPSFFLPMETIAQFQRRSTKGLDDAAAVTAKEDMRRLLRGKFIGLEDGRVRQIADIVYKGTSTYVSVVDEKSPGLHAEECVIMPMQERFDDWKDGLTQALAEARKDFPIIFGEGAESRRMDVVDLAPSTLGKDVKNEQLQTLTKGNVNVVFVHAAVGQTEEERVEWKMVSDNFCQGILKTAGINVHAHAPLHLQYFPGLSTSEQLARWKKNLNKAKATLRKAGGKGIDLAVFMLRDDDDQQSIYELAKYLCDSKHVGIESLTINRQTLADKIAKSPSHGAVTAANELVNRLRIRHQTVSKTSFGEDADVEVAIHIAKCGDDLEKSTGSRPKLCNIVAFAVHDKSESQGYKVQTYLKSNNEIRSYDPSHDLAKVLGSDKFYGTLLILRSGFMPPDAPASNADAKAFLRTNTAGEYLARVNETLRQYKKGKKGLGPERNDQYIAQHEFMRIADAIRPSDGEPKISYVLVREAVSSPLAIQHTAKDTLEAEIGEADPANGQKKKQDSLIFTRDPLGCGTPHTIGVRRASNNPATHDSKQPSLPTATPKSPILTLFGDKLADDTTSSAQQQLQKPVLPLPTATSNDNDDALISHLHTATLMNHRRAAPPIPVTQSEMQRLAEMFTDANLEMRGTKVPVLMHLAQKAAGRAALYLRVGVEVGEVEVVGEGEKQGKGKEMVEVDEEVAGTLWFL